MTVVFSDFASRELVDSVEYYNIQMDGLGDQFKDAVKIGISRITEHPYAWEAFSHSTRKYTLGRFPYKIIYTIVDDTIFIVSVANSHRNPDYWVDGQKT